MKRTIMIKKRYEFKRLYLKGKVSYSKNLTLYLMKNNLDINKLGIAIGKKSGIAVERNRIKRLIRENYKNSEDKIKNGYNILISVNKKSEIKNIDFYIIRENMNQLFKDSGLWMNKE